MIIRLSQDWLRNIYLCWSYIFITHISSCVGYHHYLTAEKLIWIISLNNISFIHDYHCFIISYCRKSMAMLITVDYLSFFRIHFLNDLLCFHVKILNDFIKDKDVVVLKKSPSETEKLVFPNWKGIQYWCQVDEVTKLNMIYINNSGLDLRAFKDFSYHLILTFLV